MNEKQILNKISSELKIIFGIPFEFAKINTNKKYGMELIVRPKENGYNNIAHCHIKYEDKVISISLENYSILENHGFNNVMEKRAIKLVKENINDLNNLWEKYNYKIEL